MIKWLSDQLGTASHDQVTQRHDVKVIDVRDMVDKPGNLPETARAKIEQGVAHLKRGEKVVVCCDHGISRSNAVAAGILALHEQLPFNDAVQRVMDVTGENDIKIDVLAVVREALKEGGGGAGGNVGGKRVLITGGSGCIGGALSRKLGARHEVHGSMREDADLAGGAARLDLIVKQHNVNCIVHLANPRIRNTNQAMGESLVLLKNVLDVCRENRLRLIYPSSWEVYSGYRANYLLASERVPPLPRGICGETNYLCECLLEQHHRNYGLDYLLLRSGPVYGGESDRPKFIFNFLQKAARGEDIVTHQYLNGSPMLDLLHTNDFTSAIAAIVESDLTGTLHVGSGRALATADVARLIIGMTNSKSEVKHREIQEYTANIVMDSSRARSILGWQPTISFEEGLRELLLERTAQPN